MYNMKTKFKKIWILLIAVFFIILLSNFSNSSSLFETLKTCSQAWNSSCNSTILDDCFKGSGGLNGTQPNGCNGTVFWNVIGNYPYVSEIYINQTNFYPTTPINATCEFNQTIISGFTYFEYLWYYNTTNWINIQNWTNSTIGDFNRSASFVLNSTEGTHIVRCILSFNFSSVSNGGQIPNECANITYSHFYDNDDVNFTVTSHLTYNFWNLTNYTNGSEIASGQTYNRTDSYGNITYIVVAANWSKNISSALIEHNGTGEWKNYTITPNGAWTNYTLNLSNASEFNNTVIAIRSIYANDTYSASNNTSTLLYFYLSSGNAPNVTNFWFNYSGITTNRTNKYTNLTIYANASDDVGLSSIIANITYPNGNSINVTMSGSSCYLPNWCIWNYTFGNDLHLNSTGNYTVRITAFDIGNQNKSSGTDPGSPTSMNFTVYSNYTLNLTSNYTTYMRGENVTVQALDVNNFTAESVNWIANITKINQTYSFTPQATTFNYTILLNDTEGNYSIIVNASKNNNTGNNSWNFNVSRTLYLVISTFTTLSPGNTLTVSVDLYNARGELYTNFVNANITCKDSNYLDTVFPLSFSSGHATSNDCHAANAYSTSFNITTNVSDQYNNTGENYTTLTTTDQTIISGGGGGGGGGIATPKNCSDGTLYNQCSSNRPLYCKNGVLIENCSICKCESGYECQLGGSCKVTILENFSFTLDRESIEIERGENSSIIASLSNTGNTPLSLITSPEGDCCNVTMEENFSINENEKRDIPISIHVPLFTDVGEHLLKIKIGKEYFKKEETVKVIVTDNSQYTALIELGTFLNDIENKIAEYKRAGVDVTKLEESIKETRKMILNANSSIGNDNLEVLKSSIKDLRQSINSITSTMTLLGTQKFLLENKLLIALFAIMAILTVYLVPEVFVPLYDLEGKIRKLKTDEKDLVSSRVETEKQYFMRKIDENTFSKIMITKQDQILKLKATIEEREKGRKEILLRMHPKEMLKWFGRGIKNLPKNIKNLFSKIFERVNLFKKKTEK